VPFADGRPNGTPEDVLAGFVSAQGDALGRPVGVAIDRVGALLVADDVGNIVWRVTPAMANRRLRLPGHYFTIPTQAGCRLLKHRHGTFSS
jgi:hypothetical protein